MKERHWIKKRNLFNDTDDFLYHYEPWCREDAEVMLAKFYRLDPKSYGNFIILTPGLNRTTGLRG